MRQDPEAIEVQTIREIGELAGAHVLEIGAGDGRLLRRYQASVDSVVGVDPRFERLINAQRKQAQTPAGAVTFAAAMAESLPFADKTFDGAVFAWSL